ncbi:MAG TPA: hypothetical protein VGB95_05140, partial [Chitinophagales bacterium]
ALALIAASTSSCKKACGHCIKDGQNITKDDSGNFTGGSSVCENSTLKLAGLDEYKQSQANCAADTGTWVIDSN